MEGAVGREDVFQLVGTVVNGRFRVDAQIAEGGFAVVYSACQEALDRRVALKVLKPPAGHDEVLRAQFREKFAAEAKTIARLKHPHIVDVYDYAISAMPSGELAPWMALEWVDGETLEAWLGRRRAEGNRGLASRESLVLLCPVIQALAFAHRQGIVHRDIKPGNIIVGETERGPLLRVLDFGIAKIMAGDEPVGSGQTRTGSIPAFSPAYAAPEQVTFSRTGPWTDVHALGLILSEVMTGQAPFADRDASVHEQVMSARRPTPASRGCDVGPLEAVIAKAVALSPGDRWNNAGELLAALESASARDEERPRAPVGTDTPLGRPQRARRAVTAAILASLAAVGTWSTLRATNKRQDILAGGSRPIPGAVALRKETFGTPTNAPVPTSTLPPEVSQKPGGQPTPAFKPRPVSSTADGHSRQKPRKSAASASARLPASAPAPVPVDDGRELFNDPR